jgi:selenide,water dikinase
VYRLDDERALVETLDFFSPVVDDPYDFGRVAAANAFSDVYAMGARPLFALNILCFPMKTLGHDVLARVLAGGDSIAEEAGVSILGGHSVEDPEPKYGMVVTGLASPSGLLKNTGARPGDVLFLTKPLGSGILTTAVKKGAAPAGTEAEVVRIMATLNRAGSEAMMAVGAHAATDVTGFGLLGHLKGMVHGTGVGVRIEYGSLPFIDGLHATLEAGICPGGTRRNLDYFGKWAAFDEDVSENQRLTVADAQTSGGLLIACAPERADDMASALAEAGTPVAARIGSFLEDASSLIRVVA